MNRRRVAIVGPTCTGKTRLAVDLALRHAKAELLNADSRQLRSGTHVATFRPTPAELRGVPCHLLDLAPPGAAYTVAEWARAAREMLAAVEGRGALPIAVGGSGLFVRALVDGLDFGGVPPDPEKRAERSVRAGSPEGLAALAAELVRRDPDAAASIDMRNPRRVVRALEILDARPGPLRASRSRVPAAGWVLIGLDAAPATHRDWVTARVGRMFRDGSLLDEVERLRGQGVSDGDLAGAGIGYDEAVQVLAREVGVEAAIAATVRRTLQYAKAQRAWFRRDRRVCWLRSDELDDERMVDAAVRLLAAPVGAQ